MDFSGPKYLPSLNINYVAINKDGKTVTTAVSDKAVCYEQCYVDIEVIATIRRHYLFYLQDYISALEDFFSHNCSQELVLLVSLIFWSTLTNDRFLKKI